MTVRLGLIADTHIPARWLSLPASVAGIFAGVDLILHAGDVGELAADSDTPAEMKKRLEQSPVFAGCLQGPGQQDGQSESG